MDTAGDVQVPNGAPAGFVPHAYSKVFRTPHGIERVWAWPTFTEGQVWPYQVEFVDRSFEPGVLNVHHGPFLNVAGIIGEVRDLEEGRAAFRDLQYFYGSYAISPRLFRPTRLRFWAEESGGGTTVTLQLDCLARRPFARSWSVAQGIFWSRFPRWMDSALRNSSEPAA